MKEGHVCPKCGSNKSGVFDSRTPVARDSVYMGKRIRRRECKTCGFRWVTVELHWHDVQKFIENFGDSAN